MKLFKHSLFIGAVLALSACWDSSQIVAPEVEKVEESEIGQMAAFGNSNLLSYKWGGYKDGVVKFTVSGKTCSGVLVNERTVVSAASCFTHIGPVYRYVDGTMEYRHEINIEKPIISTNDGQQYFQRVTDFPNFDYSPEATILTYPWYNPHNNGIEKARLDLAIVTLTDWNNRFRRISHSDLAKIQIEKPTSSAISIWGGEGAKLGNYFFNQYSNEGEYWSIDHHRWHINMEELNGGPTFRGKKLFSSFYEFGVVGVSVYNKDERAFAITTLWDKIPWLKKYIRGCKEENGYLSCGQGKYRLNAYRTGESKKCLESGYMNYPRLADCRETEQQKISFSGSPNRGIGSLKYKDKCLTVLDGDVVFENCKDVYYTMWFLSNGVLRYHNFDSTKKLTDDYHLKCLDYDAYGGPIMVDCEDSNTRWYYWD